MNQVQSCDGCGRYLQTQSGKWRGLGEDAHQIPVEDTTAKLYSCEVTVDDIHKIYVNVCNEACAKTATQHFVTAGRKQSREKTATVLSDEALAKVESELGQ